MCSGIADGCACRSLEEDKRTVDRFLKTLEKQNFSPPFNEVSPLLFIGDLRSCFKPPVECTHVVSLTDFVFERPKDGKAHLAIHMEDDGKWPLLREVSKAVDFCGNQKTLVHCVEGKSRSAAVSIGLLMKRENKTFEEAFAMVKKARPRIAPLQGFLDQLKQF